MARNVLKNNSGKGTSTLGSKAGNVSGSFGGGKGLDRGKGRKVSTGKNSANASRGKKRGTLSFSNKDGQRQAGSPALSGKTRGPAGRKRKSKGVSGK